MCFTTFPILFGTRGRSIPELTILYDTLLVQIRIKNLNSLAFSMNRLANSSDQLLECMLLKAWFTSVFIPKLELTFANVGNRI